MAHPLLRPAAGTPTFIGATSLASRDGVKAILRAGRLNKGKLTLHLEVLLTAFESSCLTTQRLEVPRRTRNPGRPPTHPKKLYNDAGYDCEASRTLLRWLGIEPHIRHRNDEHGSHLRRGRRVVERTISWIKELRRMRSRRPLRNLDRRLEYHCRRHRLHEHPHGSNGITNDYSLSL